jgi:flagellar hook-basal body complex protein FliE
MANIDQLQSVNLRELINQQNKTETDSIKGEKTRDFGETITDFIHSVNNKAKDAAEKASDVVQGKSQNIHQAMVALEESGLSFKLMLEIRNKLLESYKEVERMQV